MSEEQKTTTHVEEEFSFEDLFRLSDIQQLQDEFAKATGVASIITHTDGTPITAPSSFCRLCMDIIRKTEKGCANCYHSDAQLGRCNPDGPIIQPCMSGGLWDAGAAITVGGRHIANWLIGQVRDETQTVDKIRRYAREIGADEEAAAEAFLEVPSMTRERFEKVAQSLFTLANMLSRSAYQNLQLKKQIAQRELAERALRKSEEKYRRLSENVPAVVYVFQLSVEGEYSFPFISSAVEKTMGVSAAQCMKDASILLNMVHPEDKDDFYANIQQSAVTLQPYSESFRCIVDNSVRYLEARSLPVKQEDGSILWEGLFVDSTDRTLLEKQLLQAQKVESIGRLAGGVAHDLNNLLTPIIGYSQMLVNDLSSQDPNTELAEEVLNAGKRAQDLVHQLLAFARKQTLEFKTISVNETIARFEKLLIRTIRENIKVKLELSPDTPPIRADKGQIEQVIMNLSVNAADAMPDGGRLTIKTEKVIVQDDGSTDEMSVSPGSYALLTLRDTGRGMDAQTAENVFEPFFSTKGEFGTGLGLATVYGVVRQHGGQIFVQSELGEGTTFRVFLPATEEEAGRSKKKEYLTKDLRGTETILLVEDSEPVRLMTSRALARLGYKVLTASDANSALALMKETEETIDLLLTDVIMPGKNGKELYDELKSETGQLKAIFMSGYTDDIIAQHGILDEGLNFIHKPFAVEDLAAKIRAVISER